MNFNTVPFIVVCCYIIGELFKLILNKKTYKYIPMLLSFIGGIIGLLIYLFTPNLSISNNIYDSILIGIISGTSSTGYNQIIKKILKQGEQNNGI